MPTSHFNVDENFGEREREVLDYLSREQNAYFSFQGLRRGLGIHQETLTRTLKRLEEADVVEHSPEGYKVKGSIHSVSFTVDPNHSFRAPLVDAVLPTQVDVTVLFQRLRGRWFSNFRWLGNSSDGENISMNWISEDGQMQLRARISGSRLRIEVDSSKNLDEARRIAAAYQLFEHVSRAAEDILESKVQPALAS